MDEQKMTEKVLLDTIFPEYYRVIEQQDRIKDTGSARVSTE